MPSSDGRDDARTQTEGLDLRHRTTRAIGWVAMERWSSRLVSLGVFVVVARLVPVDEIGLVSLVTVFTALLTVVAEAGFAKALVQRDVLDDDHASTAFWAGLIAGVVLGGSLAACSPLIASLLGDPRLAPLLAVQAIALPLATLASVPAALLERRLEFRTLSIRQVAGTVAGAAVAVPMALAGAGAWALTLQVVTSVAVATLVLWVGSSWRPRLILRRSHLRDLTGISLSFLGVDLLNAVQANIDKLLIGVVFDPTTLGYYFLAQRVLNIMSELVTSVLGRVALSTLSRVQDDDARFNAVLQRLSYVSGLVTVPLFAIAATVGPQLIPFVFGNEWVAAVLLFQLLAPSAALASITYFDTSGLLARGQGGAAMAVAVTQNVVGIALMLVAVPFGVAGVAVARSARIVVVWPLRLWLLRSRARVDVGRYLAQVGRAILGIVPIVIVVPLLQTLPWAQQPHAMLTFALPVAAMSGLVYAGLALLVAGRDNRRFILSLVRRRRPGAGTS